MRIVSHPIRIEALRVLQSRAASPKELAGALNESVNNVSYHFKFLRQEGCIEVVGTEQRRGAVEHFYRATEMPADSAVELRNLLGEAVRALNAGTFDTGPGRPLEWMPMELDEEGLRELSERQAAWAEEMRQIGAKAAERLSESDSAATHVVTGTMGFETPGAGFTGARRAL